MTPDELIEFQVRYHAWMNEEMAVVERELYTKPFRLGAPIYLMDRYFCRLVDEARRTIPDAETLDPARLPTSEGWVFLEEPAPLPVAWRRDAGENPGLRSVGWFTGPVARLGDGDPEYVVQVTTLRNDPGDNMGIPWSSWGVRPWQTLLRQMQAMEQSIEQDRRLFMGPLSIQPYPPSPLHEARWFYTAVNLMANKLTLVKEAPAPRALRRRSERDGVALPALFRTVTLRRVEAARRAAGAAGQARDWQWQWQVRGHWRHYRTGKIVFIDSYIKGPVDKPLKATAEPFFKVTR